MRDIRSKVHIPAMRAGKREPLCGKTRYSDSLEPIEYMRDDIAQGESVGEPERMCKNCLRSRSSQVR